MITPKSLLLLTSSSSSLLSLIMLLLQSFFQTSQANNNNSLCIFSGCGGIPHCTPSACGILPNITSPFRLKAQPKNCGYTNFELSCENDVASIYSDSRKYYVKAINYENSSMRAVDAAISNVDACSFPNSSTYSSTYDPSPYMKTPAYSNDDPFYYKPSFSSPINFIRCPLPLNNSNYKFTDITHDCASNFNSSHLRYAYVKVGRMNASEVPRMCGVDVIVMTSWEFKDLNNVSLSEIHRSLMYGLELYFCSDCNSPYWKTYLRSFLMTNSGITLFLLVIAVVIGAGVGPPGLTIILFTVGFTFIGLWKFEFSFGMLIVVISAPRFIIFALALWLLIYKFKRRHLSIFDSIECFLQSDNKLVPIRYSYSDLKKMTKNFQEKLGEGGFSCVYRGKLRSGDNVAVKLLGKSGANSQDFMNEIATIGRIHHVNVVKLIGYCAGRSKRALVFDFMPNGSLEKYIFNREKKNFLNWGKKFDIAVGVARGIEYLHRGCDIQILHFDIKPHNVLLDDNFIPKISDFGLAKYFAKDKNSVTLTAARGTIGYVAPELINRGIGAVSYKADVYSFGMLMMEIVGLKKDLMVNNDDSSKYFPHWIYERFNQGKDIEIENVDKNNDSIENDNTRKLIRKMTIVALWCIQMSPNDRPSMCKVLEMLEADIEHLQIPDYPSQSTQIVVNANESGTTCSSNSSPSVEIIVEE